MSSPVLVDVFGDIVAKVSTKLTPILKGTVDAPGPLPNIVNINYLYGVPEEITKVLTQWTASETFEPKKYPLVALIQPFDEISGGDTGISETGKIRLIIAGLSNAEWLTHDRYTKNFKPVLYPILDELLNQMFLDQRLFLPDVDNIGYTKRDWPFWDDGKNKNPFNDKLDVIEVIFNSLKINLNHCQ